MGGDGFLLPMMNPHLILMMVAHILGGLKEQSGFDPSPEAKVIVMDAIS